MGYNCAAPTEGGRGGRDIDEGRRRGRTRDGSGSSATGPLADELPPALGAHGAELVGADEAVDQLDAVVFVPWDPAVVRPVPPPSSPTTTSTWPGSRRWTQRSPRASAPSTDFAGGGGRIVLTTPTTGLRRGCRYGHWAAAAEGVHLLAKSTARQWGPEGISVNTLAVGPERVLAEPAVAGPVSIAAPAVPNAELGDVLAFLCSPAAAGPAGLTLTVDGGVWM